MKPKEDEVQKTVSVCSEQIDTYSTPIRTDDSHETGRTPYALGKGSNKIDTLEI